MEVRRTASATSRWAGRLLTVLRPPERFAPEVEAQYRAEIEASAAGVRREAVVLIAAIWLLYVGWDEFHQVYRGSADISPALLIARGVGLVTLLTAALLLTRPLIPAVPLLGAMCLVLYGCALFIMIAVGFPNNFLFYFTSLPLFMLLMFGLFRLSARSVALILGVELLVSYAAFSLATTVPTQRAIKPDDDVELKLKEATTGRPGITSYVTKGNGPLSYYNLAAVLYLLIFAAIGMVIAVERERLSRETFARERALSANNARLAESERATHAKTAALVEAQNALREAAERRNVEKTAFLRNLAHDLRNALAVVTLEIGSMRDILRQKADPGAATALDNAERAASLATRTLRSVLDMASLESEQVTPVYTAIELAPLLRGAALMCAGLAEERGVRIRLRPGRSGVAVRSDVNLLERLIGNLVSNAVKYSDPAKGARQGVVLGGVIFPGHVRVDIVDNGIGIARTEWARIFEPFVQLDNQQRDRERGVGLGLSIASGIVHRLAEHRLDMHSTPGRGTRFSIEIPRAPDLADLEATPDRMGDDLPADAYLLVVEDDPDVREATLAQLRRTGMLCDGFADLAGLTAALPDIERVPDLILTDYRLPALRTGEDVIALVRAHFDEDVPALVFTGEIGPLPLDAVSGSRPRVLEKPVTPRELMAAVAAAIRPAAG